MKKRYLQFVFILSSMIIVCGSGIITDKPDQKNKSTAKFVKHTISPGLIMAGYQGWFDTPDDGANLKWYHYDQRKGLFEPGSCTVDLWPDMSEYEKQYPTAFKFGDGTTATVFSAHDESSVRLHFKWMKDYGVDGVFMQRFVNELKNEAKRNHIDKVLTSASKAAMDYDRTICVMYDLSGMRTADTTMMKEDWLKLKKQFGYDSRKKHSTYLFYKNRPVVAIWGVGFSDRRGYTLSDINGLIKFFKSEEAGNCSILLGVPTYWREQGSDCVKDTVFHTVIQKADIIHPWFVGRFNEEKYDAFKSSIGLDQKWCDEHNMKYMPVVFPGFSWDNLFPKGKSLIARNHGIFYWKQLAGASGQGAQMIYVAMFDEIDEGTAIFKTAHKVPVCEGSKFVALDADIPTDHYLWLTGQAGKMMKNKKQLPMQKPIQNGKK
jgi:glycoprotein endo-alpha-1,2-mannosidase